MAPAEVKDDLSRFVRLAESEEIVITRHGKPAGVLIGFESEEDWFDYLYRQRGAEKNGCTENQTPKAHRRFESPAALEQRSSGTTLKAGLIGRH